MYGTRRAGVLLFICLCCLLSIFRCEPADLFLVPLMIVVVVVLCSSIILCSFFPCVLPRTSQELDVDLASLEASALLCWACSMPSPSFRPFCSSLWHSPFSNVSFGAVLPAVSGIVNLRTHHIVFGFLWHDDSLVLLFLCGLKFSAPPLLDMDVMNGFPIGSCGFPGAALQDIIFTCCFCW